MIQLSLAEVASVLSLSATANVRANVPVLGYARVTIREGRLVAVATDRYCVGRVTMSLGERPADAELDFLIDLAALKPFVAAAKAAERATRGPVLAITLSVEDGAVRLAHLAGPATTIPAPRLNFPPVERLFPETFDGETAALHVSAHGLRALASLRYPADPATTKDEAWTFSFQRDEGGKPKPFLASRRAPGWPAGDGLEILIQPNLPIR